MFSMGIAQAVCLLHLCANMLHSSFHHRHKFCIRNGEIPRLFDYKINFHFIKIKTYINVKIRISGNLIADMICWDFLVNRFKCLHLHYLVHKRGKLSKSKINFLLDLRIVWLANGLLFACSCMCSPFHLMGFDLSRSPEECPTRLPS